MRRALKEAGILLAIALVPAIISGTVQVRFRGLGSAGGSGDEVTVEEVREWPAVLWVDARSRAMFEKRHIPGAVLLNAAEWDDLLTAFFDAWNPDVPVVVYCDSASCDASHAVAARMRETVGLEDVHVLKGGWEAWRAAQQ